MYVHMHIRTNVNQQIIVILFSIRLLLLQQRMDKWQDRLFIETAFGNQFPTAIKYLFTS